MTAPWHQHASVPVAGAPSDVHQRLVADPADAVATATGLALARLEPLVRSWGLAPSTLPSVTAQPTGPDEIGAIELRWSGDEDATAWPSLVARLLVVPDHASDARLVFLTPRSPRAELATRRVGRVHRERILDVAVQRFLQELAVQVERDDSPAPAGPPMTRFDRRPIFVHHVEALSTDPATLAAHLLSNAHGLAGRVTDAVLEAATAPLAAGRFRQQPDPDVHVATTAPGSVGVLDLGWTSDEEATGWPQITLTLAVEAAEDGTSRLVVLSEREPGYDLSTNRLDKRARDLILRELGAHVATAVAEEMSTTVDVSPGAATARQELARA